MAIETVFLADHADAIPIVARWYFDEWGPISGGDSVDLARDRLLEYTNRDEMPLILLATRGDDVIAAAQLKYREIAEMFPEKEHWLGGVYVPAGFRRQGIASALVEEVARIAPRYGVRTLHLQTDAPDGGLYARLGWIPVTRVNNDGRDVLVMERTLSA